MKTVILFLFLLSLRLAADPIVLYENFAPVMTRTHQIAIEDANATLTSQDVLEGKYASTYPKYFTSYTRSVFWTKVTLKNGSDKPQNLFFRNPRTGTNIDATIYQGKTIKASYALGGLRNQKFHSIASTKSVFELSLNPGEEVNVITRFESLGAINLEWEILSPQKYSYSTIMEIALYAFFGGVMLALVIYNMSMFLSLKEPVYLMYILHGITLIWYQYSINGMFYFLDIGINFYFIIISTWISPFLTTVFFVLLTITFFKFHDKNKKIFSALIFFGFLNFVIFLLMVYQLIDPSLLLYTAYFIPIPLITGFFIILVSLYALTKKYVGALYFLIGEGLYMLAVVYVALGTGGYSSSFALPAYIIVPFAVLIEMILLSMALAQRVAQIKSDNNLKSSLLIEEEKFVSVGKTIGNVTHQWKEPISQLSSYLMYFESLYRLKKHDTLLAEFGSNIEKMNTVLVYMKGTVDDLYDFYSNSDYQNSFNLKKQIDMACKLQRDNLILSHIDVVMNCPENIIVSGAKHAFANILMILFDNSIYQLTHAAINYPVITITVTKTDDTVEIRFGDNGSGIDPKVITKIFTSPCTTKGENGCGIGLPLAKKLINERLNGSINVTNDTYGALFTMTLKQSHISH